MKVVFVTLLLLGEFSLASAQAQDRRLKTIAIRRSGSQASTPGQTQFFTGSVQINPLFSIAEPGRASGASVTFEPGARTVWHMHPLGQTLIVTAGTGWVQQEGRAVEEIRQGDVIQIPAGVRHWHGATATTRMTHIAIQEQFDGKVVQWMEKVNEAQYKHP